MFAPISHWGEMAKVDYSSINGITPADSVTKDNFDGTYNIELFDEEGAVIDIYTIEPKSVKGTNQNNEPVDLPQTGNNSPRTIIAISLSIIGLFVMKRSLSDD